MKLQLSISILVSDRKNTVKKSLDSLIPLLKAVSSELIVVYTGTAGQNLKIAEQYTDHIVLFDWCDDFSAARNAGMEEASGEWFLFLDDDEWFEDLSEIISFFQTGEYKTYGCACYLARNYLDWTGRRYVDAHVRRMTRLTPEIRFTGRVHESMEPVLYPIKYFQAFVHHYGYVSKIISDKSNRNTPLLLKEIKENPKFLLNYVQIAQEYFNIGEYKKAEEYCRRGLKLDHRDKNNTSIHWILAFLPQIIVLQGDETRAVNEAKALLKSQYACELSNLELYLTLAPLLIKQREYKEACGYIEEFRDVICVMDTQEDLWSVQQQGKLCKTEIKRREYQAYLDGILCCIKLEDFHRLTVFLRWLPWNTVQMKDDYYVLLEKLKSGYPEHRKQILESYSRLTIENSYIDVQKALLAELCHDEMEAFRLYTQCEKSKIPCLQHELVLMAFRNNYDLSGLIGHLDIESWELCCNKLISAIDIENHSDFLQQQATGLNSFPVYSSILEQNLLEYLLSSGKVELDDVQLERYVKRYCEVVIQYYKSRYLRDLFQKENDLHLPKRLRLALKLSIMFEKKLRKEYSESIRLLKSALEVMPSSISFINRLFKIVEYESQQEEKAINPEMITLGEQVKNSVKEMIQKGEYAAAFPIIMQLMQLIPDDLEVLKLKQKTVPYV